MASMYRFDGETIEGQLAQLTGDEAHHAINVKRIKPGEAVWLTDGKGRLSKGVVESVTSGIFAVRISEVETVSQPALTFVLVQALAKGDRDELAVQAATELGVHGVIPWQANRSVSRWEGAKVSKQVSRWQSICDEACKQSLRASFPKVEQPIDSRELAAQIQNQSSTWLILDPTSKTSITQVDLPISGEVFLVVGPEGGITDEELAAFESNGASRVNLGSGILRTSTAGMAALSHLSARAGFWD